MAYFNTSDSAVDLYARLVPEYTRESVAKALRAMRHNNPGGGLDLVTFDYYMRPTRLGGLGYGDRIDDPKTEE